MGKSKKESKSQSKTETAQEIGEPKKPATDSTILDPSLSALFASSAGPIAAPTRASRSSTRSENAAEKVNGTSTAASKPAQQTDDEILSSVADDLSDGGANASQSASEDEIEAEVQRPRKRRRVDQNEDLESKYLDKLVREEEQEQKQLQAQKGEAPEDDDSDLNSGLEDLSDSDADIEVKQDAGDKAPKHESLTKQDVEAHKMSRTVFLGNVSNSVIKSKSAKKTLIKHLQSGIDTKHHEKIESIRFRSTAFASDAGPKRAAYAKKELMEETMKSTNAYVVLSSDAAARKIATRLNGSTVLDRHLRVDNLGNPSRVDHRRCVFVGNLSFVDEATATDETEDGTAKRKRAREPADVEEGLWRTFGKCGKVESVRVVRDKETRISKGFAYVQFTNENSVEAALLLNEKKFPPMLPRVLRVMRAKKEMKSQRKEVNGTRNVSKGAPRGRGTERRQSAGKPGSNIGSKVVFEGHRANSNSMPKGLKKLKKRLATKPDNRSSKRAAAFKAGGGKKKRDLEE